MWVVSASIDAGLSYPVAVLRGDDNPAFNLVAFKEWLAKLEKEAKQQTKATPKKTYQARCQGYVQNKLLNAGLDPKWINGDSTKVFVAWLIEYRGYESVDHEHVSVSI